MNAHAHATGSASLQLADPDVTVPNFLKIMERAGCTLEPDEFLRSFGQSYRAAQRTLHITDPDFRNLASHNVFMDGLAHAARRLTGSARILVLGCSEEFMGCSADYAAQAVCDVIPPQQIAPLRTWNLTRSDLKSPPSSHEVGQFDLVVTNSVLHFIAELSAALRRVWSLLDENGMYLMVHEPNSRFWSNRILVQEGRRICIEWTADCRRHQFFQISSYWKKFKILTRKEPPVTFETLVNRLLADSIGLKENLTSREIAMIVDPHRPSGPGDANRIGLDGFDETSLTRLGLDMVVTWKRSYNYLGNADSSDLPEKWQPRYRELERLYPADGAAWTVLWTKRPSA
jgi:hypothetical protein